MRGCVCCSGLPYKQCCEPFHHGSEAPTPLQLMRSRYSAYALGLSTYIQKTTHPHSPYFDSDAERWRKGIEDFCRTTKFLKLEIRGTGEKWVSFAAHLFQSGKAYTLEEISQFEQVDSHWRYLRGEVTITSS